MVDGLTLLKKILCITYIGDEYHYLFKYKNNNV